MAKTKRTVKRQVEAKTTIGEFVVEVDLTDFQLEDWELLDPRSEGVTMKDMLDCLDRLIVGGVRDKGLPGTALFALQKAVFDVVEQEINPTAAGKN